MNNAQIRNSKFLSLVLRHKPEAAGIELDAAGWVDIDALLAGCRAHGHSISRADFNQIVKDNDKQRFVVEGARVRAAQGHSLTVDLGYLAMEPPEALYHGTVQQFLEAIKKEGLKAQSRQHVHLSADSETAVKVGSRRGQAVVLVVQARRAHADGVRFYRAANGVWLADAVPAAYLDFSQLRR